MPDERKYRAFLSYSHNDRKWADWLHRELERYRVPLRLRQSVGSNQTLPRNLRPVFRDRDELPSGSSLPQVIHDALTDSESLIVICSPSAVSSQWVDEEIRMFQQLGRHARIFCVIVDGEPNSGGEQECFPEALRKPVDISGQPIEPSEEPIAADLRGGKHDRRHAKLMLIAGLLGIGLDELLQRDSHQRSVKLFAITIAATLLAVIMAGLMVFAILAKAEAERRRADAENLVGFMLGDLRRDLRAIQRLDLLDSVSDKAMEYFRSLGEDGASDEMRAQRARALLQIGSTRLDQGDMQGALEAFNQSLVTAEHLVAKNPGNVDWNLMLAEGHFYVGQVHWQRGDLAMAAVEFQLQLSIVDALAAAEPQNIQRLTHSGYAWTNYGRILELNDQFGEALQAYETVMDIFQRLAALQPADVDTLLEVGFAHNNLGKLKTSMGLLDEAEEHYRRDLEIKLQAVESNPKHNLWREYLAGSMFWLGKILSARNSVVDSIQQEDAALLILDTLLETDPAMTPQRQRRAEVHRLQAANCRMIGDSKCSAVHIQKALSDLEVLTAANPDNARWNRELGLSKLEAAWQAAASGEYGLAASLAEDVVKTTESAIGRAPENRETWKLMVTALLTLGDITYLNSQSEAATTYWQTALSMLETNLRNSSDPEWIDLQAKLLARTEHIDAARHAENKLEQIGYFSPYPRWSWDLHTTPAHSPDEVSQRESEVTPQFHQYLLTETKIFLPQHLY